MPHGPCSLLFRIRVQCCPHDCRIDVS
jgi:hypothetical protein